MTTTRYQWKVGLVSAIFFVCCLATLWSLLLLLGTQGERLIQIGLYAKTGPAPIVLGVMLALIVAISLINTEGPLFRYHQWRVGLVRAIFLACCVITLYFLLLLLSTRASRFFRIVLNTHFYLVGLLWVRWGWDCPNVPLIVCGRMCFYLLLGLMEGEFILSKFEGSLHAIMLLHGSRAFFVTFLAIGLVGFLVMLSGGPHQGFW